METDIEKMKPGKINTNSSFESYLNISFSHKIDTVNDFYNVSPIESNMTGFRENTKTQSLITLSDVSFLNSAERSMGSINVSSYNSEKSFTNDVSVFLNDIVEKVYSNTSIVLPQVLFNAPKRCKKLRRKQVPSTLTKQKFQKCTRLVRLKIVHFKYKHPEKNIRRKLKTYYDKTKVNCSNSNRIQHNLYSDLALKTVSRSRILKKVLAKVNLLDDVDKIFFKEINEDNILENDPSEDTLIRINSESSQNDSITTKTIPSVVEVATKIFAIEAVSTHTLIQNQSKTSKSSLLCHEMTCDCNEDNVYFMSQNMEELNNVTTFKTDIVNVAIAQVTNTSILKYNTCTNSEQSHEEMLYKENLTSAESFMTQSDTLDLTISTLEISETNTHLISSNEDKNCIVLTDLVNTFDKTSDSDTFVIAKTSSYFKNNTDSSKISSNRTLTPSSDLTDQTEPWNNYFQLSRNKEGESTLLDTLVNVGIYHLPIGGSKNEYSTEKSNNVIITDEFRKILPSQRIPTPGNYPKNVTQKSFSLDNEGDHHKSTFPNEDTIRKILTETEKTVKNPCSEEFRSYAPPPGEWEKLAVFLDLSLRRMEDSLVQKIANELKTSLDKFEKYFPFSMANDHEFLKTHIETNVADKSDLCKMESGHLTFIDESLQCGLVQNEVIDRLISKVKVEGDPETIVDLETTVKCPPKLIESKIIIKKLKDSFEVLKPPTLPCTSNEHGDSLLTTSLQTSEGVGEQKIRRKRHLRDFWNPILFFKANVLVLTSVPAFFVSIFLVYKFFVLLIS